MSLVYTEVFARCFAETVGEEGGFSANPDDPGNWTGGEIGHGACHGTKFGISAASYPALDIASLSLEDAKAIYARDYWAPIQGDKLPPALAMILFDAAVNIGVAGAIKLLQGVLNVERDGILGPLTLEAILVGYLVVLCAEFQIRRLLALPLDARYIDGWRVRIMSITLAAGGLLNG